MNPSHTVSFIENGNQNIRKSAGYFVLGNQPTTNNTQEESPKVAAESQNSNPQMRKIKRTPSDEFLLTELAIDRKNITIYDISSLILVREKETHFNKFKCYMDHTTAEFFIEATDTTPIEAFTRSTFLKLLETAEAEGAEKVYMCIREDIKDHKSFLRTFAFLGFKKLTPGEQELVSITDTHTLMVYDLKEDERELD